MRGSDLGYLQHLTYSLYESLYKAAAWCSCHAANSCAVDYLIYQRPS
jgi:hypothetical protein